jgi:hypothetical protein
MCVTPGFPSHSERRRKRSGRSCCYYHIAHEPGAISRFLTVYAKCAYTLRACAEGGHGHECSLEIKGMSSETR